MVENGACECTFEVDLGETFFCRRFPNREKWLRKESERERLTKIEERTHKNRCGRVIVQNVIKTGDQTRMREW